MAGCDGTRSAPSALNFVPRCSQSALSRRPKLRFGPENLTNSTLFTGGVGKVLELISNRRAELDFFVNLILKHSIVRKMLIFPIIEGFWFRLTNLYIHQILILQVRIPYLERKNIAHFVPF